MRLIVKPVRRSVFSYGSAFAALLVPAALLVLSPAALAGALDDAQPAQAEVGSFVSAAPDVVTATPGALIPATLDASALSAATGTNDTVGTDDTNATNITAASAAADPVSFGDDGVFAGAGTLDDQTLSRQRGGAVGMVMVAATPQLMRGNNSVTLWDEIAPPAPLPIPVDATQSAQGNLASYTRK